MNAKKVKKILNLENKETLDELVEHQKSVRGKHIAWDVTIDKNRGTYHTYHGFCTEINGNNLLVNGIYHWIPNMENIRVVIENGN